MKNLIKKIFFIVLILNISCISLEKTKQRENLKNNVNLIKSLQVKYQVFIKPRQLILKQKGVLINQGYISMFRWANGSKKLVQVKKDNLIDGWVQDEQGGTIIKDFKNNMFIHREIFITQPYIFKEEKIKFNWKIDNNKKKKINNFVCKYAETFFRGRKYIAWFTPEIPIQDGPWKFYGLPGLILEVYDTDNFYKYKAYEINFPIFLSKIDTTLTGKTVDKFSFYHAYEREWLKIKRKSMAKSKIGDDGKLELKMIEYHPQEILTNK